MSDYLGWVCAVTPSDATAGSSPQTPSARDVPLLRRAVQHTRGLVLAETLVAIVIGFTIDDLALLRVPGYLVGLGTALFLLVAGGLVHGYRLAARLEALDPATVEARLGAYQTRGRLAAIVAAVAFLLWAVFFTQGVPPWAL